MDNNCQLLRVLLKLLETSRDSATLAVGCNDLAQFVAHIAHGGWMWVAGRAGVCNHSKAGQE